jgi:hypothetical protein
MDGVNQQVTLPNSTLDNFLVKQSIQKRTADVLKNTQ